MARFHDCISEVLQAAECDDHLVETIVIVQCSVVNVMDGCLQRPSGMVLEVHEEWS